METREYKCSFGIVKLTINGDQCNGNYQNNGEFNGTVDGNIVTAKWKNEGQEGLIELDLSDDKLTGKWKQGLDKGPMRGKWKGVIVNSNVNSGSTEKTGSELNLNQIIEKIKVDCKDHESIDDIIEDLSNNDYLDYWAKQLIDDENDNVKQIAKNLYKIYTDEITNSKDTSSNDFLCIAVDLEHDLYDAHLAADFYTKAENSAENYDDYARLGEKLIDSNKEKANALFKKAESLAKSLDEIVELATLLIDTDEDRAAVLLKKAESMATTFDDYSSIGESVSFFDLDWGKKLYEKASKHISDLHNFNKIIDSAFYTFEDYNWGSKITDDALEELTKVDDMFEFCGHYDTLIEFADNCVNENGLNDKEFAKNVFNKLKEYESISALLEGGRRVIEIYGLDDNYAQEFCNEVVVRATEFVQEGYYMDIFRFIKDDLEDEDRASDFYSEYEEECEYDEENY